MDDLTIKAIQAFWYGIHFNIDTDIATCTLHEDIAGDRYSIYDTDDDPIVTITSHFTNAEKRKFIQGVIDIVNNLIPDAISFEEFRKREWGG